MTKKYIAKYGYHQAVLVEIEVIKETEKTVTRQKGNFKELINHIYYLPDRLTRTEYHIFDTQEDALDWLILQANNDVKDLRSIIEEVNNRIGNLLDMREKV